MPSSLGVVFATRHASSGLPDFSNLRNSSARAAAAPVASDNTSAPRAPAKKAAEWRVINVAVASFISPKVFYLAYRHSFTATSKACQVLTPSSLAAPTWQPTRMPGRLYVHSRHVNNIESGLPCGRKLPIISRHESIRCHRKCTCHLKRVHCP